MFSKRILSIVGLLFIGSQITSVSADCSITLKNGDGGSTDDSFDECNCDVNGYYVVRGDSADQGGTLTLSAASGSEYKYVMVTGNNECSKINVNSGSESRRFRSSTTFSLDGSKDITLGDSKSYILTDGDSIFTGNASKKVIVKSTSNSVVLDSELMEKTYNYCVDDDLVVWNRKADICNNSSGDCTYYQCADGECTIEDANLSPIAERVVVDCDLASPDTNCQDGGYYLYDSLVGKGTTVLKNGDSLSPGGTATLVQCTSGTPWICNTPSQNPIGYVTNAGAAGEFIKCVSDGTCTAETNIEEGLVELTAGIYMIDISENALLGITAQSTKFVNIIRTNKEVLVDQESEGYYTVSGTVEQTRAYPVNNAAAADLYSCTISFDNISLCEKVENSDIPIGYLVNKGVGDSEKPFIKCDINKPCEAVAPAPSCSTNHGDLYVDGESTKICGVTDGSGNVLILAGTGAIDEEKYYMASVATTNDKLFDIKNKAGYFIVLKFKGGNVTVENDSNARYRYTKINSNLIVDRSDAITDTNGICKAENGGYPNAYEYILANWDGAKVNLDSVISYYVSEEYNEQNN